MIAASRPPVERVVLVDTADRVLGSAEKLEAHVEGRLHRAFSVFVFDGRGRMLLQRRAVEKYHSGGLWSNTCCGHPRPDEETGGAARRRLREEMGIECDLDPAFSFEYRAALEGGLWEHEIDHVLTGRCEDTPLPDPAEVGEWRWAEPAAVLAELRERPETFTAWFPLAAERAVAAWRRAGARSHPPGGADA